VANDLVVYTLTPPVCTLTWFHIQNHVFCALEFWHLCGGPSESLALPIARPDWRMTGCLYVDLVKCTLTICLRHFKFHYLCGSPG
jgi:hypothetical protein